MKTPRQLLKQVREIPDPSRFLIESAPVTDSMESLASASPATLENLVLSRLNTAANLRKDIALLISKLAEELADVKIAELLLHQKITRGKK
jgi:hypothetical protein